MKVMHITPTHLMPLVRKRNCHFALGQNLITDSLYSQALLSRARQGAFVIVDNGESEINSGELEERVPFDKIVKAANAIGADEIVMPDVFRDKDATLELIESTGSLHLVPPRQRMLVPQGETLEEWWDCLMMMVRSTQTRAFGIPKHMERFHKGRHMLCKHIEEEGLHEYYDFHLLGVWDDPYKEIPPIVVRYPWVRSIDTGIACAYAQHGLSLVEYAGEHISLDWGGDTDTDLAIKNLDILESMACTL